MAVVVLSGLAGLSFGALTVAVRWGLGRHPDAESGALVTAILGAAASMILAAPAAVAGEAQFGKLWPFFLAGVIAPGASQILLTLAVRHAGPSRAAILMGTAPLISITIALTLLGEQLRPLLVVGTILIVLGGIALAREPRRSGGFHARGAVLAIVCAAAFATRDNIVRWAARGLHPSPVVAASATLLAATVLILVYVVLTHREGLHERLWRAVPAFAPAGVALAIGYDSLLAAFDHGGVSVVSPLNATGSLWAVLLSALVVGSSEAIGWRIVVAAVLIVAGGALIGVIR